MTRKEKVSGEHIVEAMPAAQYLAEYVPAGLPRVVMIMVALWPSDGRF